MANKKQDKQGDIEQLKFDDKNFNKHTEYGMGLLEKSLRENGAGRSILVDKDDNIIAGNGIVEAAINAGIKKTRVVEVTGDELVVVKRTDLELDSKKGRQMAFADNATAAADLSWDEERIGEAADEWGLVPEDWGVVLPDAEVKTASTDTSKGFNKLTLVFTDEELEELEMLAGAIDESKEVAILTALRSYGS